MRILCRELDSDQRRIAWRSGRNLLVIAGPGAGKTRLLTNVAAYRLRLDPTANWKVLCLTFTVEAAKQMRSRLASRRLGVPRRDRVHATNFHGFAAELLAHYGDRIGWPRDAQVLSPPEARAILLESAADLHIPVSEYNAANDISRVKGGRSPAGQYARTLTALLEEYQRRMRALAVRDYDDLILDALRLLQDEEVLQVLHKTYRHILVDELQDTSQQQLDMVGLLSGEGRIPVFGVADDDQMIYAFRDARPENVDEWETRFGAGRFVLAGNYRCPPRIVAAANAIISRNRVGDPTKLLHSRVTSREGEILLVEARGEAEHADFTAAAAAREIALGRRPEEIAVVGFANRRLSALEPSFARRGLPTALLDTTASEAEPAVQIFRAALAAQTRSDDRLLDRLTGLVAKHSGSIDAGAAADLLLRAGDVQALLNLVLLLPIAQSGQLTDQMRAIVGYAASEFGDMPGNDMARRLQIEWSRLHARVLREETSVKLLTAHKAKGLEYEVVIIPHMNRGAVPPEPRISGVSATEMAEKRRAFYVSVTRASHRIYFVTDSLEERSPFLDEIPAELVERAPVTLLAG